MHAFLGVLFKVGHGLRISLQQEMCEGRTMQLFVAFYFSESERSYPSAPLEQINRIEPFFKLYPRIMAIFLWPTQK